MNPTIPPERVYDKLYIGRVGTKKEPSYIAYKLNRLGNVWIVAETKPSLSSLANRLGQMPPVIQDLYKLRNISYKPRKASIYYREDKKNNQKKIRRLTKDEQKELTAELQEALKG